MADSVLVVTSGLSLITTALVGLGAGAPKFIQWGLGTTGPLAADTDLETKGSCNEDRVSDLCEVATDVTTDNLLRCHGLLTRDGVDVAITEVATFNITDAGDPPTGGVMFLRATFDAINLVAGNSIDFTIDTKFVPV